MKLVTICKFDITSSFGKGVEQWESASLLWKCKLVETLEKQFTIILKMCQRRQWHPTPVLLPGKSHGWKSLVGCSPWGR